MNTLTQVRSSTGAVAYRINAPAYAAALTRSKGTPSRVLRDRLIIALDLKPATQLTFRRGDSGKWYVRTGATPLNIAPVAGWNRRMIAKHGTGAAS